MESQPISPPPGPDDAETAERLLWLLRLRWMIVPVFVAVDLANDLLVGRPAPWSAIAVGGALLAANGVYSILLARRSLHPLLLSWTRVESAVVVAVPVVVVTLHGDPTNVLRYGVLVGVVGAAVILRRPGEVAMIGMWAISSLIVGDAITVRFDPARIERTMVARWAMEAGIIGTVAVIAGYLQAALERVSRALRDAREELRETRADWETAFDGLREMVVVTDEQGRVLRANRAFAKSLGARPHDLAGRPLPEVLDGHPSLWWSQPGDAVAEIEDPVFDTAFEITSTRAGTRTIRVACDVGEARRLFARLVQMDKLAAVGTLASGVAHEVNNPTAVVMSNLTELGRYLAAYEDAVAEAAGLAAKAGQSERAQALLARADVACARREAASAVAESLQGMERIRRVATNLRAIARRDRPGEAAAPVELSEVLDTVVRAAAAELRAAAARVEAPSPVWVLGNRGELVDVVLNLVVNAIQSRAEGRPNRIGIALRREGANALIRVSDTGRGIAAAHLKRLYDPLPFAAQGPGEGAGLGLSLARKIVLSHGGALDVSTEVGTGSTFTVRLPAVDAEDASRLRAGLG